VKTASVTGALGEAKSSLVVAANDASTAARNERAEQVANEYDNTNPALSEGERKRIAWTRAQKKNPEIFGKTKEDSSGSAA
jgi:ABC-type lipoprotein export system ATPase subunit